MKKDHQRFPAQNGLRVQTGLQGGGNPQWCADCFSHCDSTTSIGSPRNIDCKDRCCMFDDICDSKSAQCKPGYY